MLALYCRQRQLCTRLFGPIETVSLQDIPFEGLSAWQIIHILFENASDDSMCKKIKTEIRKWHPDKFKQKLGVQFVKGDNDPIMNRVNIISQALNVYAMTMS